MSAPVEISRRQFLKVSALSGVGLVISVYLPGCRPAPTPTATPEPSATATGTPEPSVTPPPQPAATRTPRPTAAVTPTPEPTLRAEPQDEAATPPPEPTATPAPAPGEQLAPNLFVRIDRSGGVTITVPRVELGQGVRTALAMILAEELEAEWSSIRVETAPADEAYGRQRTTGSHSVEQTFTPLRQAGAVAREMLIAAAAQTWGVAPETCHAESGAVIHATSGQRLTYGDLVEVAATLPAPDTREVTLKEPQDFRVIGTRMGQVDEPQMVDGSAIYGLDVRVPGMLYAVLARCPVPGGEVLSFDPALATPGVRHVIEVDGSVAVVAENTWAAIKGREALTITWDEGQKADLNSDEIGQRLRESAQSRVAGSGGTLEAVYEMPFLAHAPMEPMNCTADVRADHCTVWAPTQDPQNAQKKAAAVTRLPQEAVTVYVPLVGGGFGRRSNVDYVGEAVGVSQAVGAPVQVLWTREDDIRHSPLHPLSVTYASTPLGGSWRPSTHDYTGEGSLPTTIWRSVTNVPQALAHECLLDEFAAATGRDAYELRRELLRGRERAVLELAAEKAGWGTPLPAGWGRGMAFHSTWDATPVAQVAEVSVSRDGQVRVQRVVCAVDCGITVNPEMVEAQMEGGIVFGLSAALKGEITVENGRIQQSNLNDYPILRMDEMPVICQHRGRRPGAERRRRGGLDSGAVEWACSGAWGRAARGHRPRLAHLRPGQPDAAGRGRGGAPGPRPERRDPDRGRWLHLLDLRGGLSGAPAHWDFTKRTAIARCAGHWREIYEAGEPLCQIGAPDDVANVVVFLASTQARWLTGQHAGVLLWSPTPHPWSRQAG